MTSADRGAPAVSILCPAYRTEQYLPATVESVLAQTRPDWELVLVDNGRSQAVVDIAGSYADPRLRLIRQDNQGMAGGFTAAGAAARGRYVLPLASDDLLVPTACARLVEVLDGRPEIDVLTTDAHRFDDATQAYLAPSWVRSVGVRPVGLEHRITMADVVGGRDLYYSAAFRRRVWEAGGGYADGNASDLGLFLRVLRAGHDVRVLPERLGVYRLRADSLSRDPAATDAFAATVEGLLVAAVAGSDDPDLHEALTRRLRRRRHLVELAHARRALQHGQPAVARAHARRAVRHQRTPRSLGVYASLVVAPGMLSRVHPYKRRLQAVLSRAPRP